MDQGNDAADAKTNVAETDPDVDQHAGDRHYHCDNGVALHFVTDRGADGLHRDQASVNSEIAYQTLLQSSSLIKV